MAAIAALQSSFTALSLSSNSFFGQRFFPSPTLTQVRTSDQPPCLIVAKWTTQNNFSNKFPSTIKKVRLSRCYKRGARTTMTFFFNPFDEPILKEAIKEPVAFLGGIFAGLLRLDSNEEPLKDWINKTVQGSGITEQEINIQGQDGVNIQGQDAAPQEIDID